MSKLYHVFHMLEDSNLVHSFGVFDNLDVARDKLSNSKHLVMFMPFELNKGLGDNIDYTGQYELFTEEELVKPGSNLVQTPLSRKAIELWEERKNG